MWKKLTDKAQDMCIKATAAVRSFKADERGLSGVVVAILLILVAVLAVVIIWGFLSGYLQDLWDQITANGISADAAD